MHGLNQKVEDTLYINGQQIAITEELIIQDSNGNRYIALRDLAELLGYDYNNSEYQSYGVDTTKCYIKNGNLISGFELGTNIMYKYEEGTNLDYQYYTLNYNIVTYNNKLYIAMIDLIQALNSSYTIATNNEMRISSMENLAQTYQAALTESGYTISPDKNNQKALAYGWIIASRNGAYSILNTNFEEIIGTRYSSIYFDEYNSNYIVSNASGQYGIIKNTGTIQQTLRFDGLEILNYENMLYKVKNNNKYGIMKADGTMLTQIIYDEIGYQADPANKILYTLIIPDLDGTMGKTIVVKQNEKYGLISLETGETYLACDHLDKLYSVNELGEIQYRVEVESMTLGLLEYITARKEQIGDLN